MSKILVTGANGFIGRALCSKLLSLDYRIISLTSKDGDISDNKIFSAYENEDIKHIFHLASKNFVPDSWTNTSSFYQTNVLGTQNLLEFCRRKNVNLTYISAYLYGNPEKLPISESDKVKPNNPYAHSKYLAEQLCEFYSKEFKFNITVIRPFNVYGAGQRNEFLIPKILEQAQFENSIKVMDLLPRRDYIYISDVIEALILSLLSEKKFSVYNVGSGASINVQEIIDVIQKALGTNKPVYSDNQVRINELSDVVADIARIKDELGWVPSISFDKGIKQIINKGSQENE